MKLRTKNKTKRQKEYEWKHLLAYKSAPYMHKIRKCKLPSRFKPALARKIVRGMIRDYETIPLFGGRCTHTGNGISMSFPEKRIRLLGMKFYIVVK